MHRERGPGEEANLQDYLRSAPRILVGRWIQTRWGESYTRASPESGTQFVGKPVPGGRSGRLRTGRTLSTLPSPAQSTFHLLPKLILSHGRHLEPQERKAHLGLLSVAGSSTPTSHHTA